MAMAPAGRPATNAWRWAAKNAGVRTGAGEAARPAFAATTLRKSDARTFAAGRGVRIGDAIYQAGRRLLLVAAVIATVIATVIFGLLFATVIFGLLFTAVVFGLLFTAVVFGLLLTAVVFGLLLITVVLGFVVAAVVLGFVVFRFVFV